MKRLFVALALTTLALPPMAPPASAQTVVGRFQVQGTNLDGSPYRGTAQVTAVSDTTCTIAWQTGNTTSRGICMRQGDVFVASYKMGDVIGLATYRWRNGNEFLDGTWTIAGQSGTGTERLIPVR